MLYYIIHARKLYISLINEIEGDVNM